MNQTQLLGVRTRLTGIALFVMAGLMLVAGGYVYYRVEAERIRQGEYAKLAAIAKLKAGQINQWRQERLGDIIDMVESPLLERAVEAFRKNPADPVLRADLQESLTVELREKQYSAIFLLAPDGTVLLTDKDAPDALEPDIQRTIAATLTGRQAALGEPYRDSRGTIYIDTVAAVLDGEGRPLAAVILRSAAGHYLYPLIQSWPLPNQSAETLLVRREGEAVVFLNELRHRTGTALTLRQPLTNNTLPAVQAVLGKTGLFEGLDYRGMEVLADLRPIADSTWFMVTKMDTSEILAETIYRARAIALFVTAGILLAAAVVAFAAWQRRAKLYQALYEAEWEQRRTQEFFRATLFCIGDGVIGTDREMRVTLMNPVAEMLTGWTVGEARGRPLAEVFDIVNAQTRLRCENPAGKVLAEGKVAGLANHTILIARDGVERQIADSAAPIRDAKGATVGVVLVFRDVTDEYRVQDAVRQERDRAQGYLDTVETLIVGLDVEGRITMLNRKGRQVFGYEGDELIGKNWFTTCLLQPEGTEAVYPVFTKLMTGELESVEYFENSIVTRSGARRQIAWHNALLRDEQGTISGILSAGEDITERRQAEEELKNLFDLSLDMVCISNIDTATFLKVNPACEAILGYPPAELAGRSFLDLLHPDDRQTTVELVTQKLRQGEMVLNFINRYRCKDGSYKWLEWASHPIPERGLTYAVARDITGRKRMEQTLALEKTLIDAIFNSVPGLVYLYDAEGRLVRWNKKHETMTGYSPDELARMRLLDWYPDDPESQAAVTGGIQATLATGFGEAEARLRKKDGTTLPMYFTASPLTIEGQSYFAGIGIDITDQKRREEELKQKNDEITRFLFTVSHDLKSPLITIKTFMTYIEQDVQKQDEAALAKDMGFVRNAADKMALLLDELLELSRIGRKVNPPECTPLQTIAQAAVDLVAGRIAQCQAEVVITGQPVLLHGDTQRLVELYQNLIDNAIKFMGGQPKPRIEIGAEPDGRTVKLWVRDNGGGIEPRYQHKLFGLFEKLEPQSEGVGMGLAIVKRIVEVHGGKIWVESAGLGQGSTFYFTLAHTQFNHSLPADKES